MLKISVNQRTATINEITKMVKNWRYGCYEIRIRYFDSKCWIEFDGDSHIIAHPELVKHHKAKFFATSVPLTQKIATEMPLLAVSIG